MQFETGYWLANQGFILGSVATRTNAVLPERYSHLFVFSVQRGGRGGPAAAPPNLRPAAPPPLWRACEGTENIAHSGAVFTILSQLHGY